MEKVISTKIRDKVLKHLLEKGYNINQQEYNPNIYFTYTPYGKRLIFAFTTNSILIIEYVILRKSKTLGIKALREIVNKLNLKSSIMKFTIEKKVILSMETRLQNVYNKKEFQRVLDDIKHDFSGLLEE